MKPDNWNRFAAGLLAILLCLCSFSMPAFASGSDPAPEPLPEIYTSRITLVLQPCLGELLTDISYELLLQCHTGIPDFCI